MARRVLHDRYFKQAKAEGYLARSAYKLIEIDNTHRLLEEGNRVLDLGCAPGSWLQVASERIGPEGRVVGIDLQPVREPIAPNVRTIVGDANEIDPGELIELAGGRFDAVLSDMAPKTSGTADDLVSARLCYGVLDLLPPLLRQGGVLAMKVLEGSAYPELLEHTRSMFARAKGHRPKATRGPSREMFVIATGFKASVTHARTNT